MRRVIGFGLVAVLGGGPDDGCEVEVPAGWQRLRTPGHVSCTRVEPGESLPSSTMPVNDYELAWCLGAPSVDDRGRLRYVFVGSS